MTVSIRTSVVALLGLVALALGPQSWAQQQAPSRPMLDVDELVVEALRAHPAVDASRARADAASEVPSRVSSPPDPWLSFAASNLRFDAPGLDTSPMSGLVLGVNQGLPFPGQLMRRRELADAAEDLALARVATTETMVALRVRESYWSLHFSERALAITEESAAILDSLADAITARFSVGQGAQQDALQAQVAEGRLRSELQARQEEVRTARRALAAAVGWDPGTVLGATRPPPDARPRDPDETTSTFLAANPALSAARQEVAVADAAVREAQSALFPDFGMGIAWRIRGVVPDDQSAGADMFSAGVSVSVPVWAARSQTAAIREERYRKTAAAAAESDLRLALEAELTSLLDALGRLDEELRIHRDQLLPQSDQALNASIEDYAVGRVGFVSVLQNWRVALDVQLSTERLIATRARAEARVDALLGANNPTEESP